MTAINMNDFVWVRLTPKGESIVDKEFPRHGGYHYRERATRFGYFRIQLWSLMEIFGPHIHMAVEPCFEITIYLSEPAHVATPTAEPAPGQTTDQCEIPSR